MAKNSYPLSQVANELNSILAGMFTEYSEELQEKADKVTEKVAEDFAQKLKEVTPRSEEGTVHMADTIKVTTKKEKSLGNSHLLISISIENAMHSQRICAVIVFSSCARNSPLNTIL